MFSTGLANYPNKGEFNGNWVYVRGLRGIITKIGKT